MPAIKRILINNSASDLFHDLSGTVIPASDSIDTSAMHGELLADEQMYNWFIAETVSVSDSLNTFTGTVGFDRMRGIVDRWVLPLSSNGVSLGLGGFLSIAGNLTSATPFIVPEYCTIKAMTLALNAISLGTTVTITKNGVNLQGISAINSRSSYITGLNIDLSPGDQLAAKLTQGLTLGQVLLFIFLQTG